eukprot:g4608.t1
MPKIKVKQRASAAAGGGVSSRLSSPTRSSSTKAKPAVRKEYVQLHEDVEELKRSMAQQAEAEAESRAAIEALEAQVRALKGAYNTLSEVLVEEVESIRTDFAKTWQQMDLRVAQSEKEGKRIKEAHDGLRSDATTFQAALDLKLNLIDSTLREHAPLVKGMASVEALGSTLRSVENHTRDCVKKVEEAAARQENSEKWLQQMREEMVSLRDQVALCKDDQSTATSALAQDIAALAGDAEALRERNQRQLDIFQAQFRTMAENRADEAKRLVDKFEARRDAFVSEKDQQGEKASVHWEQVGKQNKAMQATLETRYEQSARLHAETAEDHDKRFRAIGNAVGAFADILHVSNPLAAY